LVSSADAISLSSELVSSLSSLSSISDDVLLDSSPDDVVSPLSSLSLDSSFDAISLSLELVSPLSSLSLDDESPGSCYQYNI
jgi:hypothetical protein